MNRNDQGSNEQNRTYSERENLVRRQAGPSESARRSEPQQMKTRERLRHDHDQNLLHNFHDREKSYRAESEETEFRRHLEDSGWQNTPGGELSWEEQYKTDGEAHNYRGPLSSNFNEYPQYGHNLENRRNRNRVSHNDYTGLGPRGYKRSDARIKEELCELLARDHYIDASDIVVAVEDGIVKLSGTVRQREDRVEAEMLAESVIGVEDIQNDISVKRHLRGNSRENETLL